MVSLRNSVGSRIRSIRKANGLTQQQLAERAGLDDAYIGSVERGERNISIDTLEKVIIALDIQPSELFWIEDDQIDLEGAVRRNVLDELSGMIRNLSADQMEVFIRINREVFKAFK